MTEEESIRNWPRVIWRAWRYEDDEELGRHLLYLVADRPAGAGVAASIAALGTFYGAVAGLLVAALSGLRWSEDPLAWNDPTTLPLLPGLARGAIAGALLALLAVFLLWSRLTWRHWLGRLAPRIAPAIPAGSILGGLITLVLVILALPALGTVLLTLAVAVIQFAALFFGIDLGLLGGLVWGLAGGLPVYAVVSATVSPTAGLAVGAVVVLVNGVASVLRGSPHLWQWRGLWFWWAGRPTAGELEAALRQAVAEGAVRQPWPSLLRHVAKHAGENVPATELAWDLRHQQWGRRFAARQRLAALGGEAIRTLQVLARPLSRMQRTARWLLTSVAVDTTTRLAGRCDVLLCPSCLVRVGPIRIAVPGPDLHYYGCRSCGQSREFLEWPGKIVAVLDREMAEDRVEQDGVMRVSWLRREAPFDFDRVEIGTVDEEEVERFAIQVANDTDPVRRERYGKMPCRVAQECALTENTWRILERTFGRVERG